MKKRLVASLLLVALALTLVGNPAQAQSKVKITWFVGLGTGTDAQQIEVQKKVVADFNAKQNKIELVINIAPNNQAASDTLGTLIASGDVPDIVGPVGFAGSNTFPGLWADLSKQIADAKYDLKQYPEGLVNLYKTAEGQVGVPFAVFPSFLYYSKDAFDEAGLAYPPKEWGKPYIDKAGKESPWTWDKLAELSKTLTVDANGKDANDKAFDATKIVQFGFVQQWGALRNDMSAFGPANFYDEKTGKVSIPENWRKNLEWTYDGIWKSRFIISETYGQAKEFGTGNNFSSGKVAMARTHLWYTCCLGDLKAKWDVAALPTYDGKHWVTVDADTFRIPKASKNPKEAFEVLSYLLGEASLPLLSVYGGFPARASDQAAAVKNLDTKYPGGKNWAVAQKAFDFTVAPGHESDFPNFKKGQDRLQQFRTLLYSDSGAKMDLKAEIDKLEKDLQVIVDEAKKK
jgi:multiple sugar transport system substrate-binding protein